MIINETAYKLDDPEAALASLPEAVRVAVEGLLPHVNRNDLGASLPAIAVVQTAVRANMPPLCELFGYTSASIMTLGMVLIARKLYEHRGATDMLKRAAESDTMPDDVRRVVERIIGL